MKSKDYQNSLDNLIQALNVGDKCIQIQPYLMNNIGKTYFEMGDYRNAIDNYKKGLSLSKNSGDKSTQAQILFNIAKLYKLQNNKIEALSLVNESVDLLENVRSNFSNDQFRTSYFSTIQEIYEFKINLLMDLHQKNPSLQYSTKALETSDQQKARVLKEILFQSNSRIERNIPSDLKLREEEVELKISAREKKLIEISGRSDATTVIDSLKSEILTLIDQRQEIRSEIRKINPSYNQILNSKFIGLTNIQKRLDSNTVILQYTLGKENSFLWVVGKNSFDSYQLPKRSELDTDIKSFRSALTDPSREKGLVAAAQSLTKKVLMPAREQLKSKKHIIIVADGSLHKIPFSALNRIDRKDENIKPGSLENYHPLIETHSVSYLPSISLISPTISEKLKPSKTIAILADPIFSIDDERFTKRPSINDTPKDKSSMESTITEQMTREMSLRRLSGTSIEGELIQNLISDGTQKTIVLGFESNYLWATSSQLNQYKYVHFATHGFFDQERPQLSGLILSLYDRNGEPQRGFLRFSDFFNLDLPAEMVTLSACKTGLGDTIPGEGLVGITRGLMYAGAKRITVSLWDVNDQKTAQLMGNMYRNIFNQKNKLSHVESLRDAQLQMWKEKVHPYYWSAFTMQGEWQN